MLDASIDKNRPTLFVNIGLNNGVLLRTVLDPVQGSLTDTRTRCIINLLSQKYFFFNQRVCRFLGTRPVRLVRVSVQGQPSILALSSRTWLNYAYQNLLHFTPLIFENLDYAWSFSAELSPDGLIGIAGNMLRCDGSLACCTTVTTNQCLYPFLRIFQIPKLGQKLKQEIMPLLYTPRKFVSHPVNKLFYLIEADHRTLGPDAAQMQLAELVSRMASIFLYATI